MSPAWIASSFCDGDRPVPGDDFGYYTSARFAQLNFALRGVQKRAVALELPAGLDWAFTFYAALFMGVKVVPIDPLWSSERRSLALESCGLHVTPEWLKDPIGRVRVSVDFPLDWDAPLLELQTSGSSGEPKRVVHTRLSLTAQAVLGGLGVGLGGGSHWMGALPMTHAAGIGVFLRSIAAGTPMTLLPSFEEDKFLATLQADGWMRPPITHISLVPTMLSRLLDAGWARPNRVEAVVVGGAPLSDELRSRALEAGIPVRASWGMTETLGMICVARDADEKGVGRPIPGVEVIANEEGELLVRGPIVAPGLADDQGWFHTGDAGHVDAEGFVHVDGRMGSMIISGGENVFPEAVERALLSSGLVTDAFVTGEADSEWGQRVIASVVTGDPGTTAEEIKASISRLLSPWEVPKEIRLVSEINRNELGKVERRSDA